MFTTQINIAKFKNFLRLAKLTFLQTLTILRSSSSENSTMKEL